jgi:hypothetical protein
LARGDGRHAFGEDLLFVRRKVERIGWTLNKAASVEASSEDENYPIEFALLGNENRGWRATEPGSQTIRLIFDTPPTIMSVSKVINNFRVFTFLLLGRWRSDLKRLVALYLLLAGSTLSETYQHLTGGVFRGVFGPEQQNAIL